jgi:hypothetical protein
MTKNWPKYVTRVQLSQMRSALDEIIEWEAPKQPPRTYTRLTPSAETLLRLFLRIVKKTGSTGFHRSLDKLAPESGLTRASVRRGADCLKQLGYVSWNRGFGRAGFGVPNEYILDLKTIEAAGLIRIRPRIE